MYRWLANVVLLAIHRNINIVILKVILQCIFQIKHLEHEGYHSNWLLYKLLSSVYMFKSPNLCTHAGSDETTTRTVTPSCSHGGSDSITEIRHGTDTVYGGLESTRQHCNIHNIQVQVNVTVVYKHLTGCKCRLC